MSRLAAVMNATGLYTALRHDERFRSGREAGLKLVNGVLSHVGNAAVHDSLNLIEKIGFDPFGRVARKKTYAATAAGVAQFGLQAGLDLFLYSQEQREKKQSLKEMAAWMGFAHGAEPTLRMLAYGVRVASDMRLDEAGEDFARSFESAVGQRVVRLPRPPERRRLMAMLMDVAAVVDTKDPTVNGRLKELSAYAGYDECDIDAAVSDFDEVNELSSNVAGFAGGVIESALQDMFTYAREAQAAAETTFSQDPFAAMRQKRREVVKAVGINSGMAALTFFTGPVGDVLLVAAAPVVNAAVGSPQDVQSMLKISKSLRQGLGLNRPARGEYL